MSLSLDGSIEHYHDKSLMTNPYLDIVILSTFLTETDLKQKNTVEPCRIVFQSTSIWDSHSRFCGIL